MTIAPLTNTRSAWPMIARCMRAASQRTDLSERRPPQIHETAGPYLSNHDGLVFPILCLKEDRP